MPHRKLLFLSAFICIHPRMVLPAQTWEPLPDGSTGQTTEFQGVGGVSIPAYIRKPAGPGPFPVVVMAHGGRYGQQATYGMGRSMQSPTADFIQAGWAVYSVDYRPSEKISIFPVEYDDTVEAIQALRKFPFLDLQRIGFIGGSHGGQVGSRIVSRVDLKGAVLCAPAALDLIEVKKAFGRGEKLVPILKKLVGDMEANYGAPAEEIEKDPAKFHYSSALTEVAGVRCPILIVNGRNDDNSPPSIIDIYVHKLRAAGKQVSTYMPDNGPHGFYFGHPDIPEWKESTRLAVAFFRQRFGGAAPAATQGKYNYGSMDWVDPDHGEPPGMHYKTFHSATIKADVSYMVYLPPDYEQKTTERYPVLYDLHASGGTPKRDGAAITALIDKAIRAGHVAPMIIIFPNGLRGATMYSDTKDGLYPVESVIVKDLVPHVDATYRTIASRAGRALDGFSMGGFGAAHFGFKYPDVFGVVSIMAPPLLGPELTGQLPKQAWSRLFPGSMGGDLDYFHENDPFVLAAKNADKLRDRSYIRIVCHEEDQHWLAPQCEKLHRVLFDNRIAHEFDYLANVKSHNRGQVLSTLGDAGLMWFSAGFAWLQSRH